MEGLDKTYGVEYMKWYKNAVGDRFMIHHDSHRGSLFITFEIAHHPAGGCAYRITNVFEKEE